MPHLVCTFHHREPAERTSRSRPSDGLLVRTDDAPRQQPLTESRGPMTDRERAAFLAGIQFASRHIKPRSKAERLAREMCIAAAKATSFHYDPKTPLLCRS